MKNQYKTWVGTYELDPADGITSETKIVFTHGQCHSLAVAIHDMTGWELFGQLGFSDEPSHVFVKSPFGFLDIEGNNAGAWYDGEPYPLSREEILQFRTYKPCDPENARPFAELVLKTFIGDTWH
jgi:hypothetical protein